VEIVKAKKKDKNEPQRYVVRLAGLDIFDPVTNEVDELAGSDDLCFHVSQAFFPRTGAWENLRKALRAEYEESVWDPSTVRRALRSRRSRKRKSP
jgi:adenine-specific DNA-methyltransferase